ncbi:MAG: 2,3-bisphosphoglycerate-independent phosphoglycerate mutase [Holophagales bacterium]|nr:2,3-bisphosphoglycerate-independent phosphoglycerate mutase [Holophagales bacterium]
MAKKSTETSAKAQSKGRRKQIWVVCGEGHRQRFLRGVITHYLVKRGLEFEQAYSIARAVRDRLLPGGGEVSTAEIRDMVRSELVELLGEGRAEELLSHAHSEPAGVTVLDHGQRQPFSRGLLARSIHAAGIDLDRAYELVGELEEVLRREQVESLSSDDLARRAGDLIEGAQGSDAARRYRLVRRIQHLPRPLVIYVGGASGTGKSTLALELGPLLRIYRITATDTIRQVMRMLFSPQILPAIHGSSFEVPRQMFQTLGDDIPAESPADPRQQVLDSFIEQAVRINVGVRAVVERAIAENMSILVEGVHLVPPLVPFGDLEGACYQVPIMLGVADEEAHRSRFLARARYGVRSADRYVESFDSIRAVHEFVLDQAESEDVPYIDTGGSAASSQALRLVARLLQETLPAAVLARDEGPSQPPTLLLIIDGLADRPSRALAGRTPLQAAETPTLDRLAKEGKVGQADPIAPGVVPDTAAGSLALFGQSPKALARGPVEALGAGLELSAGDVALRGNFATLDENGLVVDRRAGRIRKHACALAEALDRLPLPGKLGSSVEIRVRAATEHRLAIALRGRDLDPEIRGSDPGDGATPCPPLCPEPHDPNNSDAVRTAKILELFEAKAREVLATHPSNLERMRRGKQPANAVLTRGAGRIHQLIPLEQAGVALRLACVAGDQTVLGIARTLGAEIINEPGMTANLDTDLKLKFVSAAEALRRNDLVVVHVKGADIAAHDGRADLKAQLIEQIDHHLSRLIERVKGPLRIAVAGDHATISESGQHAADPLPVLIWGEGIEADEIDSYDEITAGAGSLGSFPLQLLVGRLFELD